MTVWSDVLLHTVWLLDLLDPTLALSTIVVGVEDYALTTNQRLQEPAVATPVLDPNLVDDDGERDLAHPKPRRLIDSRGVVIECECHPLSRVPTLESLEKLVGSRSVDDVGSLSGHNGLLLTNDFL